MSAYQHAGMEQVSRLTVHTWSNKGIRITTFPAVHRKGFYRQLTKSIFRQPLRDLYFRRCTTVVSVSAGFGVGSPYISHECPAEALPFATIHFPIAVYASFILS